MVSKIVTVHSPVGIHLRPAGAMCNLAMEYECKIILKYEDIQANAKSVLSVLGACVKGGSQVELICDGPDEAAALEALSNWMAAEL